jgi:hypothetical protein
VNFLTTNAAEAEIPPRLKGRIAILQAFGYSDSPTLTHEHVRGQRLAPQGPTGGAEPSAPVQPEQPNVLRFGKLFKELAKQRGM